MPLPNVEYMQWAKTGAPWTKPGLLNCSTSGIYELRKTYRDLFGEMPSDLSLTGSGDAYGHPELKAAIAFRYGVLPANVYNANGASMANFVAIAGLINRGDTVLIEHPVYDPIPAAANALGARIVRFERPEADNWRIDIDDLAQLARSEDARLIILTNPYNPGAAWTSDDDLIRLADLVGEDTIVLVDEVYREWGENEVGQTVATKRPNLVATSSLTKVWGLSRLRAGWVIADERLIHHISRAFDAIGAVGPSPIDSISARLIADETLMAELRDESLAQITEGRKLVANWLTNDDRFDATIHPGSGFTILRCVDPDLLRGDSLHDWLLNEHNILATPGRYFDLPPTHVRFCWTQGVEVVEHAVGKLSL